MGENRGKDWGGKRKRDTAQNVEAIMTGWPSPNTPSGGRSMSIDKMDATGKTVDGKKHTASLEHAVKFAEWATPAARDFRSEEASEESMRKRWEHPRGKDLSKQVHGFLPSLSPARTERQDGCPVGGWTTPQAHDPTARGKGQKAKHGTKHGCADLNRDAEMTNPGSSLRLNPRFSLWLMGYPEGWASCGDRATRSSRKSRQSS